ncbi:MAG TPA: HAMP domain-containing sensor histidine kinase [Bryobacteraceae bacterium]|nr:HAMP domain-containing sensor histidine kinase [Bryobacteraceae bacterium]
MTRPRLTLLPKIWLSTSVALTLLFGVTAWLLQRHALDTSELSLQDEISSSLQAYESLWTSRSETLGSVAAILSSMPNVRDAVRTRHQATIRDVAGELWTKVNDNLKESAFILVASPEGEVIAPFGPTSEPSLARTWPVVRSARDRFPKQVSGFVVLNGRLFQLVLTPVYVDSASGQALISVLITGFEVNHQVAQKLKQSTGGSDFLFLSGGQVFASTLNTRASQELGKLSMDEQAPSRVNDGVTEYTALTRTLISLDGKPAGKLCILRSFEATSQRIGQLRTHLALAWLSAIALGLAVSYFLARRIVQPVHALDLAAVQVSRQNYNFRVPVEGTDELGRLATTFNTMCESLQSARQELIRQERISTIGRMASSIVHDLRNPLAAIYGGAEMMVDTDLAPHQVKRLAANIYRSSRRIQEMLNDLLQITRGGAKERESCTVREVVEAAVEEVEATAQRNRIRITRKLPEDLTALLERARMERVFLNLLSNALEALPEGGEIQITAARDGRVVQIEVADNGPGIAPGIREQLFQPFVTFGKKNGLGLGLALSRQSVLEHGGEIWVEDRPGGGAKFIIRLPLEQVMAVA